MDIDNRSLQMELLKIMKEYHRLCQEFSLRYYMLGGTCLGAIRHQGFIPWDDDMDVGMPRKDYERFCELANKELPDDLEIRFYKTVDNSPFHFAKLINKKTTLIEPKYHDYIEGIYIDVFPLDNMSEYTLSNKLRCQQIWFKHACIMNHCSTESKKGVVRQVFQRYSKIKKLDKLHASLERLMIKENDKEAKYLCNYLGAWKEREIIPVEIFGKGTLYKFEDAFFYGPNNADYYLHSLYGDYMRLPPKEKQVCRHDYYYVSLEKPYREYKRRKV